MLVNELKFVLFLIKNEIEKILLSYILCEIVNNKYYFVFEKYINKGVIRIKSKEVYENVKYVKVNKLMVVCKNKKWGIVDINGNYVVKF